MATKLEYETIYNKGVRGGMLDILGMNYAIRKNVIAVEKPETYFHSMLYSGKRVQAAGLLTTWNGKILAVDNNSGHYQPNWWFLYQAWKHFWDNERSIFDKQAIIGVRTQVLIKTNPFWWGQFFSLEDFMALAGAKFPLRQTIDHIEWQNREWHKVCHAPDCERCGNALGSSCTAANTTLDQSRDAACVSVLRSANLWPYRMFLWARANSMNSLLAGFIASLGYDITPAQEAVTMFKANAKKGVGEIESAFRSRSYYCKAVVRAAASTPEGPQVKAEYERLRDALIKATKEYKDVDGFLEWTQARDETIADDRFRALRAASEIWSVSAAFSQFATDLNSLPLKKKYKEGAADRTLKAWHDKLETLLNSTADETAGLGKMAQA